MIDVRHFLKTYTTRCTGILLFLTHRVEFSGRYTVSPKIPFRVMLSRSSSQVILCMLFSCARRLRTWQASIPPVVCCKDVEPVLDLTAVVQSEVDWCLKRLDVSVPP